MRYAMRIYSQSAGTRSASRCRDADCWPVRCCRSCQILPLSFPLPARVSPGSAYLPTPAHLPCSPSNAGRETRNPERVLSAEC